VQKWAPGATSGITVAGDPLGSSGLAGNLLYQPGSVYVDGSGNVFIGDAGNNRVQRWAPGASRGYTVAGDSLGTNTIYGNSLYTPIDAILDANGNLIVADASNNRIQKWVLGAARGYTVAGDSMTILTSGASGLNFPTGVAVHNGAIYIADFNNNRVQKWGGSPTSSYVPTTAGSYVAIVTTPGGCVDTSNAVVVGAPVTPSVSITATATTLCSGAVDTFTATPTNGGAAPAYQWYVNGASVATGSRYITSSLNNNDSVYVVLTSNAACVSPASVSSNKIILTISSSLQPAVSVAATAITLCSGAVDTFTATPTNGGSAPTYQWYVNGASVATGGRYITSSLSNNDSIYVVLTSSATCASPAAVNSNAIHLTVNNTVVPTVSASVSDAHICIGSVDSFTATSTNGGANPTYQWYLNGSPVATGATYTTSALSSNDSVWVVLTSNASCASPTAVNSLKLNVTVDTVPHIVLPQSILSGNGVVALHAPSGFYSYQWLQRNGGLVTSIPNANQDTFLTTTWGFYSVVVTTLGGCVDTSTEVDVFITGINELSTYHVNVYPNPTDNSIYVSAENLIGEHAIELTDNIGRTVFSRSIEGTTIHEAIDMSTLSSGIYMVMLRDATGVIAVRKVVKN
jgi:hypothetical protein